VQTESVYASFLEQEKLLEIKNGVAVFARHLFVKIWEEYIYTLNVL
jgi:hypothetical protein